MVSLNILRAASVFWILNAIAGHIISTEDVLILVWPIIISALFTLVFAIPAFTGSPALNQTTLRIVFIVSALATAADIGCISIVYALGGDRNPKTAGMTVLFLAVALYGIGWALSLVASITAAFLTFFSTEDEPKDDYAKMDP